MRRAPSSILLLAALLLVHHCTATAGATIAALKRATARDDASLSDALSWFPVEMNNCKTTCRAQGLVPVVTQSKKMAGYVSWLCMYDAVSLDGSDSVTSEPGSTNARPGTQEHGCYFPASTEECPMTIDYMCACQEKKATKWVNVADLETDCGMTEEGVPIVARYDRTEDSYGLVCRVKVESDDTTRAYSGGLYSLDSSSDSDLFCWYSDLESADPAICTDGSGAVDVGFDLLCLDPQ